MGQRGVDHLRELRPWQRFGRLTDSDYFSRQNSNLQRSDTPGKGLVKPYPGILPDCPANPGEWKSALAARHFVQSAITPVYNHGFAMRFPSLKNRLLVEELD